MTKKQDKRKERLVKLEPGPTKPDHVRQLVLTLVAAGMKDVMLGDIASLSIHGIRQNLYGKSAQSYLEADSYIEPFDVFLGSSDVQQARTRACTIVGEALSKSTPTSSVDLIGIRTIRNRVYFSMVFSNVEESNNAAISGSTARHSEEWNSFSKSHRGGNY